MIKLITFGINSEYQTVLWHIDLKHAKHVEILRLYSYESWTNLNGIFKIIVGGNSAGKNSFLRYL